MCGQLCQCVNSGICGLKYQLKFDINTHVADMLVEVFDVHVNTPIVVLVILYIKCDLQLVGVHSEI